MKPFNIQEVKAGKPVQTRDGRQARILTTQADHINYPIVALIRTRSGQEIAVSYTVNGTTMPSPSLERDTDLVMATTAVTKWVNIYNNNKAAYLHDTKEEANETAFSDRIACIEVTYEQ